MFERFKAKFRELRNAEPGHRFVEHYEQSREAGHGSKWKTVGIISAGVVLLLSGVVLSLPPGIPGFFLWIPGLSLIASRSRRVAGWLDRLELWVRKAWKKLRTWFRL